MLFRSAPETATFEAGINVMTTTATSAPTGWTPMDNGKMNLKGTWQNFEKTFTVTENKSYYLVIGWRNDASIGTQPPLAIDNVSITADQCFDPIVTSDSLTDTNAYLTWHADADSVMLKVSSVTIPNASLDTATADILDGVWTNNTINIAALTASTEYYVYIRAFCSNGDTLPGLLHLLKQDVER